jgi:hypothetical protein
VPCGGHGVLLAVGLGRDYGGDAGVVVIKITCTSHTGLCHVNLLPQL